MKLLKEKLIPCHSNQGRCPAGDGVLAHPSDVCEYHSMGMLFACSAVLLPPIRTGSFICARLQWECSHIRKELVSYRTTQLLGGLLFAAPGALLQSFTASRKPRFIWKKTTSISHPPTPPDRNIFYQKARWSIWAPSTDSSRDDHTCAMHTTCSVMARGI